MRPASAGTDRLPAILVIHENRGLNPHIEDVARRLALENFMAFAPDGLTSVGGYPGDDEKGGELFGKVDRTKMAEDLYAAAVWLKKRPDSTGKLGVTGFCFGGGISNALAVRMGADLAAAVPFYGGAPPAADVPKIKAAVLVHHGSEDTRLVEAWPEYEAALKAAGVTLRGPHLSGRRPRLQQRRDAAALQQGRGRRGVEAHRRLVQQVRSRDELTLKPGRLLRPDVTVGRCRGFMRSLEGIRACTHTVDSPETLRQRARRPPPWPSRGRPRCLRPRGASWRRIRRG